MSAIAECLIVDAEGIGAFLASKSTWDALVAGADRIPYAGSGYVLNTLLPYLEDNGIALMDSSDGDALSSARDTTCIVFTPEHRRFLDQLDPARFDPDVLRAYYESFNETSAKGVETAMLDGIRFFHAAISRLREGVVGVLVIG